MPQFVKASAPGSLMLFGEHAVLRGKPALVAAVEPRITVKLTQREDETISLRSTLGTASTSIHSLSFGEKFQFVEKAFFSFKKQLLFGADVVIESDIDPYQGLGSSAAITVATLACLNRWLNLSFDSYSLLQQSKQVITSIQGNGSGADAAASIWGGVLKYTIDPSVRILCPVLPLVRLYSGKKTPTSEVISFVTSLEKRFPHLYSSLFTVIENTTLAAEEALAQKDWNNLGILMNIHNGLQEALLVGTPELSSACWTLKRSPTILGAKISGSGLGDCVIGLGSSQDGTPVIGSSQGVLVS